MSSIDLDEIRQRLSLRALAEDAGATFTRDASPCPLHGGDNPTAFRLYDSDRKWHCFTRCPRGQNDGDIFTFYMRWQNCDFRTAVQELASRAGLPLNGDHPSTPVVSLWPGAAAPLDYLSQIKTPPRTQPLSHGDYGIEFQLAQQAETLKARNWVPPTESSSHLQKHNYRAETPSEAWKLRAHAFIDYARDQLLHPEIGAPARAYLYSERGLRPETWETFQLGYNPRDLYDLPDRWGFPPDDKKIWLPRGIVIPGLRAGQPWYIKVRRPLPNDLLAEYLSPVTHLLDAKFSGPRGGVCTLFGIDQLPHSPSVACRHSLLLVEGEWDAMLCWQLASDLCDVATLGGAAAHPGIEDLALLSRYTHILAVFDDDPAGDQARAGLAQYARITPLHPPAHDLSDYFRAGGDLRAWILANLP